MHYLCHIVHIITTIIDSATSVIVVVVVRVLQFTDLGVFQEITQQTRTLCQHRL